MNMCQIMIAEILNNNNSFFFKVILLYLQCYSNTSIYYDLVSVFSLSEVSNSHYSSFIDLFKWSYLGSYRLIKKWLLNFNKHFMNIVTY